MRHKILCTIESLAPEAEALLRSCGDLTLLSPWSKDVALAMKNSTVLVVRLGLTLDKRALDAAPHVRVIANATTGLDHIDLAYAAEKGIHIISLKGETAFLRSVTATAELAFGLMISLARSIPQAHQSVLQGRWDKEAFRKHSLSGKTLGIVGYGRLGEMMAAYGKALGMSVIYTDTVVKGGVPLAQLLGESDVVSLHVPLTKETENLINGQALSLMKPTSLLINTARGKIVDEVAVMQALNTETLAGYATDVLADELTFTPEKTASSLIDYAKTHQNVLITPHMGGTTVEAREATDLFIAEKVHTFLTSQK